MKKTVIKIIIIFVSVTLAVCLVLGAAGYFLFFRDVVSDDINIYNSEQRMSRGHMPKAEEFEPYKDLDFYYYNEKAAIFQSFGYTLTAEYDAREYAEKKAYFMGRDEIEKCFTHGDFEMIRLKKTPAEWEFPKLAYYYGFNDETKTIAFVKFADQDINGIYDHEVLNLCRFDEAVK